MTHADFCWLLYVRTKQTVPKEYREFMTLQKYANFGYKHAWSKALMGMRTFYQTSASFTATSNVVALPSDCHTLLSVEIPGLLMDGVTPKTIVGGATQVPSPEWPTVNMSALESGTAQQPKFRKDSNQIYLTPYLDADGNEFTGYFHYIRDFPEASIVDNPTFELSQFGSGNLPIFPAIYEEDAMMEALRQIRMRVEMVLDEEDAIQKSLAGDAEFQESLQRRLFPEELYGEKLPTPLNQSTTSAGGRP